MWRWIKRILLGIGVVILLFALLLYQPWVFLPHEHIEVSLPFSAEYDKITDINPLGEKVDHPTQNGHKGIDYQFRQSVPIYAVADGWIYLASKNSEGYDIEQSLGLFYRTVYRELDRIEPGIQPFTRLKKGQLIGYTRENFQTHWELSSSSILIRELCPLDYYDDSSRKRVEAIWAASTSHMKNKYPKICNGYFDGRSNW